MRRQAQQLSSYRSPVEEAAHGGHHAGRPRPKHLQDPPRVQSPQQLRHAHRTLRHLELTLSVTQITDRMSGIFLKNNVQTYQK